MLRCGRSLAVGSPRPCAPSPAITPSMDSGDFAIARPVGHQRPDGIRRGAAVSRKAIASCLLAYCVVTADASADPGRLIQKEGPAGCVADTGAGGCVDGTGLDGPSSVVTSPDGRNVYAVSDISGAVAVFDRTVAGRLVQKPGSARCISETGAGGCADGRALLSPRWIAVSPDGRNLYVAAGASNAVAILDRAANGTLSQKPGSAGCVSSAGSAGCASGSGLGRAGGVTVSPDGKSVYVTSDVSNAVAVFDRAANGTLTQKAGSAGCISHTGTSGCAGGTALNGAISVSVSADGKNAYVASHRSDAVAVFARASNGTLTQKPAAAGCISEAGVGCTDATGLGSAISVTVSADGKSVYAAAPAADAGVAIFDRAANGTLTQKPAPAGCISDSGLGACDAGKALDGALDVTVSPDGRSVYVASYESGAVASFDRAANGTLTQHVGTLGCVSGVPALCAAGRSLEGANAVAVSPDGKSAYVTASHSDAVVVFDRERPPPDTVRPLVRSLTLSPGNFRAASAGPSIGPGGSSAGGTSIGSRVTYKLSEPAVVRFKVQRVLPGHNVGGKCVKPKGSGGRARACSRYQTLPGGFEHAGDSGRNRFTFTGRLPALRLQPGSYRLRAVATDLAGNVSPPKTRRFGIVVSPPHIDGFRSRLKAST